jgi:predicted permease
MPDWKPEILRRLAPLKLAPTREAEIVDELSQHLEDRYQEFLTSGQSEDAAFRAALDELKGEDLLARGLKPVEKNVYSEPIVPGRVGATFFEGILQDIRYAFRMLRKSPGFTAIAILTLALGIGANTAIFSIVDCLVLRPLPVERPEQVVFLTMARKGGTPHTIFSYPDFTDIQKQTSNVFSGISAVGMFVTDGLSANGQSRPMWSCYVTGNLFGLLGLKPTLGRLILSAEGSAEGADPVLVLSYAYWKSRFDGDPHVVGKKASINGVPVTIVGVAPQGFHGLTSLMDFQGYIPLGMASTLKDIPRNFLAARDKSEVGLIARLRTGATLQQAQAALSVVAQRLSQQYPATDDKITLGVLHLTPAGMMTDPGNAGMLSFVSAVFLILAALVLVLACMNIANLFLVRGAARQREMAMRAALGARRARLVRQLLTESLLLAVLGCVAGIVLGLGGSVASSSISLHTSLPIILDFRFDWRVFAYALGAAILTGLLVGIMPALRAARTSVNEILHEGGRTSTAGGHRLRSVLVVAQVGGSLMLLIVAGLFVRSLEKAQHTDLGFDPNHVMNLTIDPHEAGYNEAQAREFFRTLLDRTRSLPGVQSASLASSVPMETGGVSGTRLTIDGYEPPKGQENPGAGYNAVSSQYFETMHISLLRGREIRDSDTQSSQHVAVIDQTMANRYWRGEDPIGRRFSMTGDQSRPIEVIGIAKNALENDIFAPDEPFFYVPFSQFYQPQATLQLRAAGAAESIAREATSLIYSIEPDMPVFDVQPMTTALDTLNGFLMLQFAAALAASLGILGLILAIVGVYGVISYAASQRTHEIGIRMALGAQPIQILKMIFQQGLIIVGAGVLGGVLAATVMARLIGSLLFGVPPDDPLTYVTASLLLVIVALCACYIPARRTMRVDPMVALRYE